MGSLLRIKKFDLTSMNDIEYCDFMKSVVLLIPPLPESDGCNLSFLERELGFQRKRDLSVFDVPEDLIDEMVKDIARLKGNIQDKYGVDDPPEAVAHIKNCNNLLSFFLEQVRMLSVLPMKEEREIAQKLLRFAKMFEKILKEPSPYFKSLNIEGLLYEVRFNRYLKSYIDKLKFQSYFVEIDKELQAYNQTSNMFHIPLTLRNERTDKTPQVRKRLAENYDDLATLVQAISIVRNTPESKTFIVELNKTIDKITTKIAQRTAKA